MATRARERLLAAADELFYAEGVRAVGVERLVEVSGVGRASFYRHFASKEELQVAALRAREERWRAWFEQAVADRGDDPLAAFDALAERLGTNDVRGCAFTNAMVEETDPDSEVYRVVTEHKEKVVDFLARLLQSAGHPRPRTLARQFLLLMDGAMVTAMRTGSPRAARQARDVAASLLDAAG